MCVVIVFMWWYNVDFVDSLCCLVFFFKQKTAYEMRISDWSSDVCSSDLGQNRRGTQGARRVGSVPDVSGAPAASVHGAQRSVHGGAAAGREIGRASCRERVCQYV